MLSPSLIQKIESLLKIKGLEAAIKDEKEVDIAIDEKLSTFTEEEIQTLKSNSYKDGKKAGVEMEVDELKKEMGLEFQGKTVKGLSDAIKKKTLEEAKIEPAEKVKELEQKLSTAQNTVKELEGKIAEKDNEVASTKVNTELYKYIPPPKEDGPAIDQDDIIYKMKREGLEFKFENGKIIPYKNGQKLTDKVGNDLAPKEVVEGFLKEKKLIAEPAPTPGGRGAGDQKPTGKPGSVSELKKQFEAQGKNVQGQEFMVAVEAAAKDNPEFKME